MTPIEMIAAERERQQSVEGWTTEHDDRHHEDGALADAASWYAMTPGSRAYADERKFNCWPWFDMGPNLRPDDRIRELVKAGALIVAEIERLQRAACEEAEAGKEATNG